MPHTAFISKNMRMVNVLSKIGTVRVCRAIVLVDPVKVIGVRNSAFGSGPGADRLLVSQ